MNNLEGRFIRIISGEARGVGPSTARAGLAVIEPFYRCATAMRNGLFDAGLKRVHRIDRPVISVGNITTGGTGKTPVVTWLADQLRRALAGEIAVLTRGYNSRNGRSDEATLLAAHLRDPAAPQVHVIVNPDRVAGARAALAQHPAIKAFIMDDGFQHRRLARDFDLVLIDATNPFGHDHVLPRGLMRESPRGLRRADAILFTHCEQVSTAALEATRLRVQTIHPSVPCFESSHRLNGFRSTDMSLEPCGAFRGRRVVAFAGIGNPRAFEQNLRELGCEIAGSLWFPDHHAYKTDDLLRIAEMRRATRAEALVTTAKDAVKIADGGALQHEPLFVAELNIVFAGENAEQLLEIILTRIAT